jgi:hypothetical protein
MRVKSIRLIQTAIAKNGKSCAPRGLYRAGFRHCRIGGFPAPHIDHKCSRKPLCQHNRDRCDQSRAQQRRYRYFIETERAKNAFAKLHSPQPIKEGQKAFQAIDFLGYLY